MSQETTKDHNEVYYFESDEPIQVENDTEYDNIKVEIAQALHKKYPERFFSKSTDFSQCSLEQLPQQSHSKKFIFEVVTIGTRVVKQMSQGMIRFFETDKNQIACTVNTLFYDKKNDIHSGDILNLLLEKNKKGLTIKKVDFLVESKYLNSSEF